MSSYIDTASVGLHQQQYSMTYQGNSGTNLNPQRFETAMRSDNLRFDHVMTERERSLRTQCTYRVLYTYDKDHLSITVLTSRTTRIGPNDIASMPGSMLC